MSVQEVTEIAAAIHVDPEAVRRRADLAEAFGPDMPVEAARWAAAALERGLAAALDTHRARIQDDLLQQVQEVVELDEVAEPWGEPDAWVPVIEPEQLDALVAPLDR